MEVQQDIHLTKAMSNALVNEVLLPLEISVVAGMIMRDAPL